MKTLILITSIFISSSTQAEEYKTIQEIITTCEAVADIAEMFMQQRIEGTKEYAMKIIIDATPLPDRKKKMMTSILKKAYERSDTSIKLFRDHNFSVCYSAHIAE